jgi:hypothetical protein
MTRTNAALISVAALLAVAFSAVPTAASEGYSSVTALTGDPAAPGSLESDGYSTVAGLTGDPAADGNPVAEPSVGSGEFSSVTALTGDPAASGTVSQPVQPPSVQVRYDGGFDWGDALIGALGACGIFALAFAGARTVARHRRATAEPRV